MMLHILGALLLPLCGWLAGDAIQARTVQHLAALQQLTNVSLGIYRHCVPMVRH